MRTGDAMGRATERLREAGLPSPVADARILLTHVLGASQGLFMATDPTPSHIVEFDELVSRRAAGEPVQYTRLVQNLPQGPRWMRTSYVPDFGDDGSVVGVYTVTIDVHDLTETQQQLARSVERDDLTDAFSRRTMMERLEAAAARCADRPVALYFIDLDGFKALNDVAGHAAGDAWPLHG